MTDDLRPRLEAVERAVTDGETDLSNLGDAAGVERRLTAVEERLDSLESRLESLDATTQAMRGYLGGVDDVTEDVERQAALALAKVESVESHVFDGDGGLAVERLPPVEADRQRAPTDRARDADSDGPRQTAERAVSNDAPDPATDTDRPERGGPDDGRTERRASPPSLVTRLRDAL